MAAFSLIWNGMDPGLVEQKSSLEIAKTRNSNFVYYEDLCYQAQQAVEKSY